MSVSMFIHIEKVIWLTVVNIIIAEAQVFGVVKGFVVSLVCLVVVLVDFLVAERLEVSGAAQAGSWMNLLPVSKDFVDKGVVEPEDWVKCGNFN